MSIKNILRWLAVPFAAIFGASLIFAIASDMLKNIDFYADDISVSYLIGVVFAIIARVIIAGAFVWCGTYAAPKHKVICAMTLASILSIFVIAITTYTSCSYGFNLMIFFHLVATVIGAFVTAIYIKRSSKKQVSIA